MVSHIDDYGYGYDVYEIEEKVRVSVGVGFAEGIDYNNDKDGMQRAPCCWLMQGLAHANIRRTGWSVDPFKTPRSNLA